jgi:hypothetical protein
LCCGITRAQDQDAQQAWADACNDALGYVGCANLASPAAAQPMIVLHWTAIAVSAATLRVGGAHGRNSDTDAEQTAENNCQQQGARDCKVVEWGSNACEALAMDFPKGKYGWSYGPTRADAGNAAIRECKAVGGASCVVMVPPCPADNVLWTSPLPLPPGGNTATVDPKMVGTWYLPMNPGNWVWRIAANGTYEFHSEAVDPTPSQAGAITANNGKWSINALNVAYTDGGTYTFQGTDTIIGTSTKLGTGTWHRLK